MLGKSYHSQVIRTTAQATLAEMLRFAITDRTLGASATENAAERNRRIAERSAKLAADGLEFLLIREKDLPAGELVELSRSIVEAVRKANPRTKILIAQRADIALAASADGIHLSAAAGELTPAQIRTIMPGAFVSVSCHHLDEVQTARDSAGSAILFAPVFGKTVAGQEIIAGAGLDQLRQACAAAGDVPVFALGGITEANAKDCIAAGATGIAAIRMFFAN
jgi:thiamine-phosphate pyrophosphorylase